MGMSRAVDSTRVAAPEIATSTPAGGVQAAGVAIGVVAAVAYVGCVVPLTVGDRRSCAHCTRVERASVLVDLAVTVNRH